MITAAQIPRPKVGVVMIGRGPCGHLGNITSIKTPNFNMFDFTRQSDMNCGATRSTVRVISRWINGSAIFDCIWLIQTSGCGLARY
jgi:hypothetical protein